MAIKRSGLRSILERVRRKLRRILIPSFQTPYQLIRVSTDRCRHYCGFRYGSNSFNPYENYIVGLHKGIPHELLRRNLEDFLLHFRPRDFGSLLNLQFANSIPLWLYPWSSTTGINPTNGWCESPKDVPDIITHFSKQGILRTRIDEEYFWLERAYESITEKGYQPQEFGFIQVQELRSETDSVYIVRDGNHRLSALVAMGFSEVVVQHNPFDKIDGSQYRSWTQVLRGIYTPEEALSLFNVYFVGVDGYARSNTPARIIDG